MSKELLLLHGPNLNLLGEREPEKYGSTSLDELVEEVRLYASKSDIKVKAFQSNSEGELIDALHEAREWASGVILNAGAYTHTSIALHDAILATGLDVVEVHITNVAAREEFRQVSLVAPVCMGSIVGFGVSGYLLAVEAFNVRS